MHFLLFSPSSYLPLLTTHNSLFMQGKPAHLQLRGSVPEPARPRVECLLCSRDLLFPSPDEHRSSSSSEDELPATKGKKNVMWYFQLRAVYRALKADRGHMKGFMLPLTPVSQHHSANENRCFCAIAQAPGQDHSWWIASFHHFTLANSLVLMHMLACANVSSKKSPEMGTNPGSDQKVVVSCEQSLWGSKWFVLLCVRQRVLPKVVAALLIFYHWLCYTHSPSRGFIQSNSLWIIV